MYAIYSKQPANEGIQFRHIEDISLFGCNVGYIPMMLRKSISSEQSEPCKWHVGIADQLAAIGRADCAIVIDINPYNRRDRYLGLCELLDVWGFSHNGWTPMLMHLRTVLYTDHFHEELKRAFSLDPHEHREPIYSVLYLTGTVSDGRLIGTWNPPRPSPTNSALMWPETMKYFIECVKARTPELVG